MQKRLVSIFFLILICLLFFVTVVYRVRSKPAPALSGNIYQQQRWNNYGLSIRIYQNNLVGTTTTSLNGYFQIDQLKPGKYQVFFFDRNGYYLGQQNLRQYDKPQTLDFHFIDKQHQPLYLIEALGFCVSIIILLIAFGILLKLPEQYIARGLFGLAFSYALINGIEFLQIITAWLGHEQLAGNIFTFKHLGITWFGPCFLYFWMLFPRRTKLLQKSWLSWLLAIPLLESVILLSWSLFGSDQGFTQAWGFTYPRFRTVLISQMAGCTLAGLYLLDKSRRKEKTIALKNKLQVIEFGLFFFLSLIIIFVLIPVAFFHGREMLAEQYNLTTSLEGIVLFSLIFYCISRYRIISFQKLFSRSTTYTMLTITLAIVYSITILFLDKIFVRLNNYLLNAYVLIFCIACILPLKDKLQAMIESFFFGDINKQHQALIAFTKGLIAFIDQNKITAALKTNLKKLLDVSFVKIHAVPEAHPIKTPYVECSNPRFKKYLPDVTGAEIAIPIQDKKLIGWLLLGAKRSGMEYSETEIELLTALASQTAVAMQNARLYDALLKTEREVERASRLASLGTLAAGLAHEIKNPLAAVNNLIKIFPQRYQEAEFRDSFMEITSRQLERINSLLNNLLNFAKPSEIILKKIDLSEVLAKTLELIKVPARTAQIILHENIQKDLFIQGDEKSLEQVFVNLALNAVQAMKTGGILKISAEQQNGKTIVVFSDNGPGMKKEILEKIFDPFFTTKQEGTGLGLSISKKILEKHGASIHVNSEVNRGSIFTLVFITE